MRRLAAALTGLAAPLLAGAADAPPPDPVHRFLTVAISPDGTRVASVEPAESGDGGPQLLIRETAPGGRVTHIRLACDGASGCHVFSPVWAPDGAHLAFGVAATAAKTREIYRTDPDGGGAERLLAFDGTLVALRYGPAGALAVLATEGATKEVGAAQAGAVETGVIGAEVREQRIGIIENGALRWASPPDLFLHEYDWLPDASGFVGTAAPGDGDANWWASRLYRFEAASAMARVIYTPASPSEQLAEPKIAPDGHAVSFIAGIMSDYENPGGDAFVLPLGDSGAGAVNLTEGAKLTILSLRWGCAPGHLLASALRGAQTQLLEIDTATAARATLWSDASAIDGADTAVSLDCHTPTTATIRQSYTKPPEIEVGPLGQWHDLTAANANIAASVRARSIEWRSDGQDVQGWLLTPAGVSDDRRLAMVTLVHGGPAAAEQPYFPAPGTRRALAEHGYALFLPNPRGSYGQGEAFTRATIRDFGHGDLRDILAGVDAVIRAAPIDTARLGIAGTSYGGFMTMWATTQTTLFRAAVARAGISDWLSYYGENGISGWLPPYFGASVYDDPDIYARSSPINFVKAAKTPTLLLVGERDIECPPPQSQEFWHALRELGTATRYIVYAGEGHDYWKPASLADADRRTVAWFDEYLR